MDTRKRDIVWVTLVGSVVNLLLVLFKFVAGIVGRSGAMVADAVHSLSDLISDFVVLAFINVASKPLDAKHPYGHGKYETMATTIISIILLAVGVGILWEGGVKIWKALHGEILESPGLIALWAALLSVVSKEVLYRYTVIVGKRVESSTVIANAWHHRSDSFSSLGTGLGIAGAIFLGERWRILDPLAAVVVSAFIIKVAVELLIPSVNELLDQSLPEEKQKEILEVINSFDEVKFPHHLRTRRIGNNLAVEVHFRVDPQMTVANAHVITKKMERAIKEKLGENTLITTHVEPIKSS